MTNIPQQKAKEFLRKYQLYKPTYKQLCAIVESQGYTIIRYNGIADDKNVENLLTQLNLSDYAHHTNAFTYKDSNFRLIFINEDLSDDEKLIALLHEQGHIYCNHMQSNIVGENVTEEFEANEFVHYVLNPSKLTKFSNKVKTHRKATIISIICIILALVAALTITLIVKEQSYHVDYYVTSTGNKYHQSDCIHVKDKNNTQRLTKEQFESGDYEPCGTCLP